MSTGYRNPFDDDDNNGTAGAPLPYFLPTGTSAIPPAASIPMYTPFGATTPPSGVGSTEEPYTYNFGDTSKTSGGGEVGTSRKTLSDSQLARQLQEQFDQEVEGTKSPLASSADEETQKLIAQMMAEERAEEERKKREIDERNEKLLQQMLEEERKEREKALEAKTYDCLICFCDYPIDDIYIFDECNHRFCRTCLAMYFQTKIKDGETRHILCPDTKCKRKITYQEVKHNVTKGLFEKYEEFLLGAALGDDPNCRWCPRPGCDTAMIGDPTRPMMRCPNESCRFTFCFNCKEEWHADATCEQYQQWKIENSEADKRYNDWAKANTKSCPNCSSAIEKNGGCNHMTCTKCKHEFCWLCMADYTSKHFKNTSCEQFT